MRRDNERGLPTQRGHIHSCKRFAEFLKRSPDTATTEDIRRFQLHLSETGMSICNRNRIMTGVKFLLRVTLRRLDLAAEIYHIREPQKIPQVMSPDETRRVLAVEFGSAVDAVQCAVEAQAALSQANVGLSPDRHINFRIGVRASISATTASSYRAMVGPFGTPEEAAQFCGNLKTAGGQCVVQRN